VTTPTNQAKYEKLLMSGQDLITDNSKKLISPERENVRYVGARMSRQRVDETVTAFAEGARLPRNSKIAHDVTEELMSSLSDGSRLSAKDSTAILPILCRVFSYSSPGLPRPMMR
jgi:hypothetical protein